MRIACSTASAPPSVKNTWSRSPGVSPAMSRAASERLNVAYLVKEVTAARCPALGKRRFPRGTGLSQLLFLPLSYCR